MPSEDELREQFHAENPGGAIDLDAVIHRSRARRRPRVAAVAVVSSLAVLGVVVPVSISFAGSQGGAASAGAAASASDAGTAPQIAEDATPVPAVGLNRCGAQLAAPAPAPNGLVLHMEPVVAAANDRGIPVTITLVNTGNREVIGMASAAPMVTLSKGGVVLWHNVVDWQVGRRIDLSPGASTTFVATFEPVVCTPDDEQSTSGLRADLPAAGPGDYELSAALDLTPERTASGRLPATVLVTGPTSPVTLH